MTAIITPHFIEFYYLTKDNTELFLDGKWVYKFENVFGKDFKDYILAYNWRDIKDLKSAKKETFEELRETIRESYSTKTAKSNASLYLEGNGMDICKPMKTLPHIWINKT